MNLGLHEVINWLTIAKLALKRSTDDMDFQQHEDLSAMEQMCYEIIDSIQAVRNNNAVSVTSDRVVKSDLLGHVNAEN